MSDLPEPGDVDEVAAVFGRAATTYDGYIPLFTSFGSRLVETAALAVGERVLDVGSGLGATLLPASVAVGSVGRVVGVDLSDEMVAQLGAELGSAGVANATVRKGNAQALDIDEGTFDVVLAQMVLHLLPDPPQAAAEILRVLAPGGRLVASVPAGGPGWEMIEELYGRFAAQAVRPMTVPYRPDFSLPATLAGAGFEIAHEEHVELAFHFADEQAWWDWGWSNGVRDLYEVLPPDALDALRDEGFAALATLRTPEGIPYTQRVHVVVGRKPGDPPGDASA